MPYPYALGAVPSRPDSRDLTVKPKIALGAIPRRLDLRPLMQPVRDQGQEGTCVGHAATSALGLHQRNRKAPGKDAPDNEILSPRDSYYQGRERAPVFGDGAETRSVLKSLQRAGCLTEKVAPYVAGDRGWRPPSGPGVDVVGDRARNRASTYRRVDPWDLNAMAHAIAQHGPMPYVLMADAGFAEDGRDGSVVVPRGPVGGWHAVVAVGYDLDLEALILFNSWGLDFGIQKEGERGTLLWNPAQNFNGEAYTLDPEDSPELPFIPLLERAAMLIPGGGRIFLDA